MGSLSEEVRTEVLCGHICDLEAENARLRELMQDIGELLDMLTECELACKHYHRGCIGDCYYVNARRKLGVEVKA